MLVTLSVSQSRHRADRERFGTTCPSSALAAHGAWRFLAGGVDEAVHGHAEVGAGADRAGAAAVEPDDFGVARQLRVEGGR